MRFSLYSHRSTQFCIFIVTKIEERKSYRIRGIKGEYFPATRHTREEVLKVFEMY